LLSTFFLIGGLPFKGWLGNAKSGERRFAMVLLQGTRFLVYKRYVGM
jgi:hypothetical protein